MEVDGRQRVMEVDGRQRVMEVDGRQRVMEVDGADVIAIRHMTNMTCSFDHRVLDGAQVGFFLADVRSFLEQWDANTPIG